MSERPSPSDKAAEYREQAEKIRTLARQMSLSDTKSQLLDAARHLDVLAEEEERKAQQATSRSKPKLEA
jgi:hypothetical protein